MASSVIETAAASTTKRKKKGPAPAIAAALDAAAKGGSVPHCQFYGTAAGCKQGQGCPFVHAGGPVSGAVLLAQFNGGSNAQAALNGASTPYQNGHGGGAKSSRRARSESQDSIEEGEVSAPPPPPAVAPAASAPAYSPASYDAPSAFQPVVPRPGREKKDKKKAKTHKSAAAMDVNDPFGISSAGVVAAPAAPPATNSSATPTTAPAAAQAAAAAPTSSRKRGRPDAAAAATAALAGFRGMLSALPISPFPLAALPGAGSVQQANGSASKRPKRAAAAVAVAPPPAPSLPQQLLAALPIAPFVDTAAAVAPAAVAATDSKRRKRAAVAAAAVAAPVAAASASASSSSEEDDEEGEVAAAQEASAAAPPATASSAVRGLPLPHADEWLPLLERTRAHGKYASTFSFAVDETWVTSRPCGPHCDGLPQVLAIDCEMCLSEDPVSRKRNHKELLRLSVVDGRSGATLLDTLVRPAFPIVDMRSWIHGVTAQHLASVSFTARHAQAAMAALCCQCTVLVGHALNNDLEALRFSHDTNVDTAMLFSVQDEPGATPALRDVVKACLKRDIQSGAHDSVADAVAALDVAKHAMQNGMSAPVTRCGGPKHAKGPHGGGGGGDGAAISSMLLVHRLPPGMTPQHIADVFIKVAFVAPTSVSEVDMGASRRHTGGGATTSTGKATVTFRSKRHAELAFETLAGEPLPDKSGRLQKRIVMQNKDYVQVRKMLAEPATTDTLAK